jgi:hypothetical protein
MVPNMRTHSQLVGREPPKHFLDEAFARSPNMYMLRDG